MTANLHNTDSTIIFLERIARLNNTNHVLKYQFILSKIKSFIKKDLWNLSSRSHTSTQKYLIEGEC